MKSALIEQVEEEVPNDFSLLSFWIGSNKNKVNYRNSNLFLQYSICSCCSHIPFINIYVWIICIWSSYYLTGINCLENKSYWCSSSIICGMSAKQRSRISEKLLSCKTLNIILRRHISSKPRILIIFGFPKLVLTLLRLHLLSIDCLLSLMFSTKCFPDHSMESCQFSSFLKVLLLHVTQLTSRIIIIVRAIS